jgi:hypothetical protein
MFVHDTVPPGVAVMKQRSDKISCKFEETPAGGRVVIATNDTKALDTVQKFLRYHNPFQFYASTNNQHHIPPADVEEVGHDGPANHI